MDIQLAALGKAVAASDLRAFVDARITVEFFPDEKYARVYVYLLDHLKDYGVPPDVAIVKQSFPNIDLEDHPQPTTYFIDQLRKRREGVLQTQMVREATDLLRQDDLPEQVEQVHLVIENHLRQVAMETGGSRDITIAASVDGIIEKLVDRQNKGGIRGYETGFPGIDEVTGGLQPEQFIVITGIPKSGKSSFLLRMALKMLEKALNALFIGFEMSNDEQIDRLLSLITGLMAPHGGHGVSLTKILNGDLDEADWAKVMAALNWAQGHGAALTKNRLRRRRRGPGSFMLSSDTTSGLTVTGIAAKIHKYRPDAVFIDGMYLMSAGDEKNYPRGSEVSLRLISRDLKKLAQSARIPIVGTTQSLVSRSRGGLTIASLGYTSAWAQDADVILGVERQGESEFSNFRVLDSRSGPRKDTYIRWDWDSGIVEEIDQAKFGTAGRKERAMGEFSDDD